MSLVLEQVFLTGFIAVFGDPAFMGVALVGFFLAAVLFYPTHPGVKIIAVAGALILAIPVLSISLLALSFGLGFIVYFALRRIWG